MKILSGDIGGTHTRLALLEVNHQQIEPLCEATLPSAEHASLASAVTSFLSAHNITCEHACFGIAGPVINQRCQTTNLPWVIDAKELADSLNIPQVWLINDLEANACGISALKEDDLLTLQTGDPQAEGNACIISAGTGLGEAGLYWDGARHRPFATEGGHTDFAPANALEYALLEYLQPQYERISWERILSGPGLIEIYRFLSHHHDNSQPTEFQEILDTPDPAAAISSRALDNSCPLCCEALHLFITLYGREAGNLALKQMATGGVFIGGGIAPKILPKLTTGPFLDAFNAKGRMTPLMRSMPVRVILNDRAALFGPALYAAEKYQ